MDHHAILDLILDSRDVTVGGGSASALAGAMAAGLAGMVARLSTGKAYGLPDPRYLEIAGSAERLATELAAGAVRDSAAYLLIKQAYALPKGTPEEKAVRAEAIQRAGIAAAAVPLENAGRCAQVRDLCAALHGQSNPNTGSDLKVADMLCRAGLEGCLDNIAANLPLIKDGAIRSEFETQAANLRGAEQP